MKIKIISILHLKIKDLKTIMINQENLLPIYDILKKVFLILIIEIIKILNYLIILNLQKI